MEVVSYIGKYAFVIILYIYRDGRAEKCGKLVNLFDFEGNVGGKCKHDLLRSQPYTWHGSVGHVPSRKRVLMD